MPFIRAGEIVLHYLLEGPEGAPVVMFSNSLATSLAVWEAQAAALKDNYRVLRYDTRGHGLSDTPDPGAAGYTIDQLADDAAALIKALGLGRVHLCGLSIGGMLGQRLAAKSPDLLASLILCDTAQTMSREVWDERLATIRKSGIEVIVEGTMERWFTKPFRERAPDTVQGIRNMVRRTPAEGYLGCGTAIRNMDLRPDGPRITCPTLVLVGEEDPATPVASARAINEAIRGSSLTIIPQASHLSPVEQPQAITGAIAAFLKAR